MSLSRTLIKAASSAADVVLADTGVTVLIYHRVGAGSTSEVDHPVALLDEQLGWLSTHHRVLSLDDAVAELRDPPAAPTPAVVVTFDDGTADFAEHAVPLLERHRVPATLYLGTGFTDEGRHWPGDAPPVSWGALADTLTTGLVTVGSHTHDHLLLDRADAAEIEYQLDRSIDLIGQHLGVAARHFAYPKAVPGNEAADRAVRQRFDSAALAGTRANVWGHTDVHRLARSPVQVSDGMRWFRRKVDGGLRLEDELRHRLNHLRYRNLRS
ncbi:MAG: polysaccharide deacetylase family protein [Actinomycetota bacterium]